MTGSVSRMSPTCRFVLAVATLHHRSGQTPVEVPNDFDWSEAIEFAQHHGLIPRLCWNLRSYQIKVPESASLELLNRANGAQALRLSAVLVQTVGILSEHQIPVVAFKGPSLASLLYANVSLRSYGDLDLLLLPEDVKRARIALQERGWAVTEEFADVHDGSFLETQCEIGFVRNETLIELQWALAPRFFSLDLPLRDMIRRAVTVEVVGTPIQTLAADDLFVALAVHGAKHLWSRIGWILDIAALLDSETLNAGRVAEIATRHHLKRVVAVACILAERISNVRMPPQMSELAGEDPRASVIASALFEDAIHGSQRYLPESLAYYTMSASLRERWTDRARLFIRLLLTPSSSEWRLVRLQGGARWLYYPIRIFRLAKRVVTGRW